MARNGFMASVFMEVDVFAVIYAIFTAAFWKLSAKSRSRTKPRPSVFNVAKKWSSGGFKNYFTRIDCWNWKVGVISGGNLPLFVVSFSALYRPEERSSNSNVLVSGKQWIFGGSILWITYLRHVSAAVTNSRPEL